MKRFLKSRHGFTIVELLLVVAILGILASVTMIAVNPSARGEQARDAVRKQDLDQIRSALASYHSYFGTLPDPGGDFSSASNESNWLNELMPDNIKVVPKDPRQSGILSKLAILIDGMGGNLSWGGKVAAVTVPDKGKTYQMKVLVINYMPTSGANLNSSITGINATIVSMRNWVNTIKNETIQALEDGSKYHGTGPITMDYSIVGEKEYLEALPIGFPLGGGKYRPDYMQILNRENICDLVDNQGLKEVWLFGYHYGNIEPAESNMAGPYGDVSNSERTNDMPVCAKTYVMYNYNYGRASSEAVHNHGHQIEAVMGHVDQVTWDKFAGPWQTYSDDDGSVVPHRCGWTHNPPNVGDRGYIYWDSRYVWTDCEDWKPFGGGNKVFINCTRWECDQRKFHIWRWQGFPGKDNSISGVTNWWDFIGDFDYVKSTNQKLIYDLEPPSVVTGLNATSTLAGRVALSWSAAVDPFGVAGYEVKRDGVVVGTTSGTTFVDFTAAANAQYQYMVASVDTSQNASADSAPLAVTTSGTIADNPTRPILDSTSTKVGAWSKSYSFLHSVGNGPNRFLVVGVGMRHGNSNSVSSVKFKSIDLYKIGFRDAGGLRTELWGLKHPPTGIGEVSIDLDKVPSGGGTIAGATSWSYVDQNVPTGAYAGNNGSSNNPNLTVSSTGNSMVVDVALMPSSGWVANSAGAGQTTVWKSYSSGDTTSMGSYKESTPWITGMSWNTNYEAWSISGVSINLGIPTNPPPDVGGGDGGDGGDGDGGEGEDGGDGDDEGGGDSEGDDGDGGDGDDSGTGDEEGCPESAGNYCYVVDPSFNSFVLWAHLENDNDPDIWNKPTAECKLTPPNEHYNYCVKY